MSINSDPRIPSCAVLLAAYNGEQWVEEQLRSILDQEGVDVTIFISVDLSTDKTLAICSQFEAQEPRVKVLDYGQRFGSAGANFFRLIKDVDVSEFDMVAFSDQDDIWLPDKVITAWNKLSSRECDVYSGDVVAFWESGREQLIKKSYPQKRLDHFFEAAGPGCTYVFCCDAFAAVKTMVVDNYDTLKNISLHDWTIYAFCRQAGYRWFIDDKPKMRYRQHENNQVGTNNNLKAYLKRLSSVSGSWYKTEVNRIAALCGRDLSESLSSRVFLIKNIAQLRRRPRDCLALLLMLLLGIY